MTDLRDAGRATDLLAAAVAAGLRVTAEQGRVVVRGPRTADPALVESLLAGKADILTALLRPGADERAAWEERAAVAEFDGGRPRAAAETLAWDELQAAREASRPGPEKSSK
jgi:hypothetical protein